MSPEWHYTPLVIPLGISILINVILVRFALRYRQSAMGKTFILFMASSIILVAMSLLEIITLNLSLSLLFADLSFLGITLFPISWLGFAMIYLGKEQLYRRLIPILMIIPITTNIIIWTNPLHTLWRGESYRDLTTTWFPITEYDYGQWFYVVHSPYSLIVALIGNLILLQSLFLRKSIYRYQIVMILLALNLPLMMELLNWFDISLIPHFNSSVLVFPISGLMLAWMMLRFQFLDLTPIARDLVVESMDDLMIVLDDESRILDLNPAAQHQLFDPQKQVIGKDIRQVLAQDETLIQQLSDTSQGQVEITTRQQRVYELRASTITNQIDEFAGRLLLMRDITNRKQTEEAYYQQLKQVAVLEERQRLAQELHDSVNQTLFAAGTLANLLPMAIEKKPEKLPQYASDIQEIIAGTSAQLRLVLMELVPDALTKTDLATIVRHLCDAYTGTTGTVVQYSATPHLLLDEDAQIAVYRIAQEALHNINKHAQATEVIVKLTKHDNRIELTIQDNGSGFDISETPSHRFGLRNMRERAQGIGAVLTIESEIGAGTTLRLSKEMDS